MSSLVALPEAEIEYERLATAYSSHGMDEYADAVRFLASRKFNADGSCGDT